MTESCERSVPPRTDLHCRRAVRHHGGGAGGGRIDVVLEVEAVRGPHAIDAVHDTVDAAARAAVPPGPGGVPTKHHIHVWLF